MMNDDVVASARPTGRMSARMQRIELISRRERHRQWTIEQKRAAVEEMLAPGAKVSEVARKYEINTGQLYTSRRRMLEGTGGAGSDGARFCKGRCGWRDLASRAFGAACDESGARVHAASDGKD